MEFLVLADVDEAHVLFAARVNQRLERPLVPCYNKSFPKFGGKVGCSNQLST